LRGRIRVELRIRRLGAAAEALRRALRPDDKTAPPWLEIHEMVDNDDLVLVVEAPLERLGSVRNTVRDMLDCLYAALKTLEGLEGKGLKSDSSEGAR